MKKRCLLVLLATASLSLMACGKKDDVVEEQVVASADEADAEPVQMQIVDDAEEVTGAFVDVSGKLQIFADSMDEWYISDDSVNYLYTVVDFMSDGDMMLVRSSLSDKYSSDTTFFRINDDNQIVAVTFDPSLSDSQPDFAHEVFDVYASDDGTYVLYANDFVSESNESSYVDYDTVSIKDDRAEIIRLGTVRMGSEGNSYMNADGDEVSEEEFYSLVSGIRDQYKASAVDVMWCPANEFNTQDPYGQLADIYNSTVVTF